MSEEYEKKLQEAMKADPEVLYVGEVSKRSYMAFTDLLDKKIGHRENPLESIIGRMIALEPLKNASPARYEVASWLIRQDPNNRLPRGVKARAMDAIENSLADTVEVSIEGPVEGGESAQKGEWEVNQPEPRVIDGIEYEQPIEFEYKKGELTHE